MDAPFLIYYQMDSTTIQKQDNKELEIACDELTTLLMT